MRLPGTTQARRCHRKKRHTSLTQAAEHIARLVAAGAAEDALEAYRCRCGGWHVGHKRGRKRAA